MPQHYSQSLFATDHQHRHGELGLSKFSEILRGLLKGYEVGPACPHASWPRVCSRVGFTIRFRNRACFVCGEVVPEVFEKNALASLNQLFRSRSVEAEMPEAGVIVDGLPSTHARQKGIHDDQLFHFSRKLRRIPASNHPTNIMPNHPTFLNSDN